MKKPDNKVIEQMAINHLKQVLLNTGYVDPSSINDNDRTPSWDGDILLYKTLDSHKKSNLEARIPVQVKGTWVQHLSVNRAKFNVETVDLRNYLSDGGVLFFLIEMASGDHFRIFYIFLLPFDIKRLLKEAGTQNRKTIKLDEFPHRYREGMLHILQDFVINKRRQSNILPNIYSLQDAINAGLDVEHLETSMPSIGITSDDTFIDEMLKHPQYIYTIPKNCQIPVVVDKIEFNRLSIHKNAPVIVNGEQLYDHIDTVGIATGERYYQLGNDVILTQSKNGLNVKYLFKGSLQEQINETKLIQALQQRQDVYIGDNLFISGIHVTVDDKAPFDAQDRLNTLMRVDVALKKLHIKKDLNLGTLNDTELRYLNYLVASILDGKAVPMKANDDGCVGILSIGNISIFLMLRDGPDDNSNVFCDFFSCEMVIAKEGVPPEKGEKASPYLRVTADLLHKCDNIDLTLIAPSITTIPYSAIYGDRVTLLALELLKYYDETKDSSLLDIVMELIDYLQENDPLSPEPHKINRLQTEKRRRTLTSDEQRYLMSLKEPGISLQYRLAASILLESYQEAEILFEQMSADEQKSFVEFPIYNLWKSTSSRSN